MLQQQLCKYFKQLKSPTNHYSMNLEQLLCDIFQLTDDYLDIFDNKNKLSKEIEQDLTTGDISLPILMAIENVSVSKPTIETIPKQLKKHLINKSAPPLNQLFITRKKTEELKKIRN